MKKTLLLGVASLLMSFGFAQVDCNIANMQGGYAGGYLQWSLGDGGVYTLIDPADDYGIAQSCGATYPYTLNTVEFAVADASAFGAGDGIGSFEYQVGVYALSGGDPCNAPGALLGSSGVISLNLAGAGLNPQSIDLGGIVVNDAFFLSFEPISWDGAATEVPSILWDDVARPACVQFVTQDGGANWDAFADFFTGGETGWVEWNVFGTSTTGGGGNCDAGTITNTTPVSICPDETADFETGGSQEVPVGNSFSIHFVPDGGTGGPGGDFFLTGVTTPYNFDSDLNGVLSANMLDPLEGAWELYGAVVEDVSDPANTVCSETTEFLLVTFLTSDDPACDSGGGPECLDWVNPTPTTGWSDFNNEFGGAPCNDGTGCPFNELDVFEVWQSEAYALDNCVTGGVYTFSHCNGPGAGSWVPEYTIIAPSGAVDAFGAGDGDGCSITWTATEDGTYLIVINEAGACGVDGNTDNGFPAITCNGVPDCGPPVECDAGQITDTTPVAICPDETADFLTGESQQVPAGNSFSIHFVPNGGTGGPGNDFYLTGVTTPYNFDNDLNGVLSFNMLDPLEGDWELYGAVVEDVNDPVNTVCSETTEFLLVTFLTAGDPACDGGGDEECLDWVNPTPTTGWSDFNNEFGGAPCNDGTGCPFNELDVFEVWQSEAYALDNCVTGGVYTFSHCNGPGAGSWVPEYTIIAPSGAIDAFGPGDGDGCSITWTASEDGSYLIVINEAGACGVDGDTDNGFPAITCNEVPSCEPVVAPENDDCANATVITPGETEFTTVDATTDGPDQPGSDCEGFGQSNLQQDIWYEYTATCNGTATMSTCGTADFDTRLAVYPAGTCPPDGSSLIACNDDGVDGNGDDCADFTSVLTWDIMQGETYLLRLGGYDEASFGFGSFDLSEDCITSIDEQIASLNAFPNPNNGAFALEFVGENGMAQIDVLDLSGKTVYATQQMMTSGTRIDIDLGDVSGLYFVRMTMNSQVQMLKVIVH